jgi:hypothetical protein
MMVKSKIQNPKSKINPKFQFQISKQGFFHLSFVLCHYFVICALVFVIFPVSAYAQPLSSAELINNARAYDGKTVTYEGEIIGEIMPRGDYAWLNLNDGANAIGVWVARVLLQDIRFAGSYQARGDWIEVTGVFQRACSMHGGDLDIHALGVRKTASGKQTSEHLNLGKRNIAIVLTVILCLVLILRQLEPK